ncbi:MAG: 2-C-methyl-D-erythritol 4-phosphate cytidylyltransferase [Thermoleophilia bacterium]|nr:2-C-methyl-D-erythritol 4-phosphate cytidylyltransferase [Thermoleophilia bacterium]
MAAAGSGKRLGAGGPKAFVPLAGRPMIEWSLDAFRGCESVAAVVIAAPPGHRDGLLQAGRQDLLGRDAGTEGPPVTIVDGGATRAQSVSNALQAVETGLVAIHDAARPLITPELIEAIVATLESAPEAAGAIAAAPVTDTVKQAPLASRSAYSTSEVEYAPLAIESTLDRSRLWAAQTPQVFRTEALRAALDVEVEVRDAATDEAMLVEAAGGTVLLHPVAAPNLKVTTPDDLQVAEMHLIR